MDDPQIPDHCAEAVVYGIIDPDILGLLLCFTGRRRGQFLCSLSPFSILSPVSICILFFCGFLFRFILLCCICLLSVCTRFYVFRLLFCPGFLFIIFLIFIIFIRVRIRFLFSGVFFRTGFLYGILFLRILIRNRFHFFGFLLIRFRSRNRRFLLLICFQRTCFLLICFLLAGFLFFFGFLLFCTPFFSGNRFCLFLFFF